MFSLTNEGKLEVFFIGNGSGMSLVKDNTNILLIKGQDHLLIDCGFTCPHALYRTTGLKPSDIKNIAISHIHGDHCGGMETFGWYNFINKSKANVWVVDDLVQVLWPSMNKFAHEAFKFHNFHQKFNVGSIQVSMFPTKHVDNMSSWGYVIDDRILFTMDACFNPNFFNRNYDYIFHECCSVKSGVHSDINEMREKMSLKDKNKTWLMHLDEHSDYGDISDFMGFVPVGIRMVV